VIHRAYVTSFMDETEFTDDAQGYESTCSVSDRRGSFGIKYTESQCSTVVRNTVVRATIRVNGKPPILGTLSPLTPQSIELKFDTDDYVGGGTPRAKNGKSRPRRAGPVKVKKVKSAVPLRSVGGVLISLSKPLSP